MTALTSPPGANAVPRIRRERPYLLTVPFFVVLSVFTLLPAAGSLVLSLVHWNLLAGGPSFAGLANFRRLFGGGELTTALVNTLAYTLMVVPSSMIIGLGVALAINSLRRGQAFWRTVYFLPVASTLAAMSIAWQWMFYPNTGIIDETVGRLTGLHDWLESFHLALPAIAIIGTWHETGFVVILFLAGLAGIPKDRLEAARLDGAGAWSAFWHVQWPALGPVTVLAVMITTITSLRVYDVVALTTTGGPGQSTLTLTYELYQRAVTFQDIGGGAVVSVVLLALVLAVTAVQMRAFGGRLSRIGAR